MHYRRSYQKTMLAAAVLCALGTGAFAFVTWTALEQWTSSGRIGNGFRVVVLGALAIAILYSGLVTLGGWIALERDAAAARARPQSPRPAEPVTPAALAE